MQQVDTRKLFTRFYQGTGEQSGTGIGLSYSKILVELHGGSIGARNNQEAGATFFFELPLKQKTEEIICQPKAYLNELIGDNDNEQIPDEDNFDTTPYSILVVDDNSDLTDFLKKSLGEYFKRIVIAADGVEALQLIKSHTPDIIVSDVMMPRMNGYELCKNIKEDITISHIPIILLTARDDKQSQLSGYKNGADAYLTKPFEIEMLMELIRNRLKNREHTKKRYLNAGLIPAPEESTFSQADETFLLKMNKIIQENLDNSNLDVALVCKEIGKSTILNRSVNSLTALEGGALSNGSTPGVHFVFSPEDATLIHFDVIRSFDRPLIHSELLEKMADKNVKTELDWQLYQLQRRYLDYQVNIGNRIIECLTSGGPDGQLRAAEMSYPKTKFQDLMDDLFGETGKKIIRKSNEILFEQDGDILYPYQLSSGEKQILVILLTVLVQDNRRGVLFMDEPEVSLHVEWQQRLISLIRQLNPNVQIVLTTHSPAVIMDGWLDAVTEVSDITK